MKKIIRLTESELVSVIKKIILEQPSKGPKDVFDELQNFVDYKNNFEMDETSVTLGGKKINLGSDWNDFYKKNIKGKTIQHLHKYNDELNIGIETPTKKTQMNIKQLGLKLKTPNNGGF